MRIIKKSADIEASVAITAAMHEGTTFYSADLETVKNVLEENDLNIFSMHQLETYGWDALKLESSLFGSHVVDDILYICVTDGQEIEVNGELINPEYAIKDYGVELCSRYIQPATPEVITRHISEYEIEIADYTDSALELLEDGYTFKDLFDAADDLNFGQDL